MTAWQRGSRITMGLGSAVSLAVFALFSMPTVADVGVAQFQPCQQVTWAYDATDAPPHTQGIRNDIASALALMGKQTSLRFVEGAAPLARLRFRWEDLGHQSTVAAEADGFQTVTFNRAHFWSLDAYAGFGAGSQGAAGRGWMIVHEVMHTLGLPHSTDPASIMYPMNTGQHAFTASDLAALHALRPRGACPHQ